MQSQGGMYKFRELNSIHDTSTHFLKMARKNENHSMETHINISLKLIKTSTHLNNLGGIQR